MGHPGQPFIHPNTTAIDRGNGPGQSAPHITGAHESWGPMDWLSQQAGALRAQYDRGEAIMDREAHDLWVATENGAAHLYHEADKWCSELIGAKSWEEVHKIARAVLGPSSFNLGAACGIVKNLYDTVKGMVDMAKMLVMAGIYEKMHGGGIEAYTPEAIMLRCAAPVIEKLIGKELKEAYEKVKAIIREISLIFTNPRKFFGDAWTAISKPYIEKWNRFQALMKSGGLADMFQAGEIAGEVIAEVILTVLSIISGGAAIARAVKWVASGVRAVATAAAEFAGVLTREAPELVEVAKGMKTAGSVGTGASAAGEAEEAAKTAEAAKAGEPKPPSEPKSKGTSTKSKCADGKAEPIYPPTGEVVTVTTDFVLPGALELRFERNYASASEQNDWLGPNWTCSWGQRVVDTGTGLVRYQPGDGREIEFDLDFRDQRRWVRSAKADKLHLRNTIGGYEVRNELGHKLTFEKSLGTVWLVSAIEDRNGSAIHFRYDADGSLREVQHTGGYRLSVDASPDQIRSISLEQPNGELAPLVKFVYDSRGCLSGVDNGSGQLLQYQYDANARMTRWSDRKVSFAEYKYDERGRCVYTVCTNGMFGYSFRYDDTARITTAIDSNGAVTKIGYNEDFRITSIQDPNGGVTMRLWDERGNLVAVTDPDGRRATSRFDSNGNLLQSTNPAGETTRFEYNDLGLPSVVIDPSGQRWVRSYDDRGNTIAAGLEGAPQWSYTYDARGHLVTATDPTGVARSYTYNDAGLILTATDGGGHTRRYERDAFGRVTAQIDPLGNRTKLRYNELQKLSSAALPDETEIHWSYDVEGALTERKGQDGSVYRYSHGAFDKLTSIVRPSGATVTMAYDLEARLRQVTNERKETWDYEYDKTGRLVREKDFSGRTQRYKYDLSGLLVERRNGTDESVAIERDAAGRMVKKIASDGRVTEFTYDGNGLLKTAKNDSITVEFERDAYGRVIREKQGDHLVESVYDARGLRTLRRVNGEETKWQYDAAGHLETLSLPGDDWLSFTHDAAGRETERRLTQGNKSGGLRIDREYDLMSRITAQRASADGGSGAPITERHWRYTSNGDPAQMIESLWGESSFAYNSDGRIEKVIRSSGTSEEFGYNEAGEILTRWTSGTPGEQPKAGSVEMRFLSAGGRLEKIGETTFAYDADGRTIEKRKGNKVWRYEWTVEGQLRSVITPDGERWTYEYDAFGRRVKKSGPRGTTTYVWDGGVLAQEMSSNAPTSSWLFEPGNFRPIAKVENGRSYACVTDQVGTPRELVTPGGKVAWSAKFSAFGEAETVRKTETDCPIRFQGQWFDEESGLHYNWNRYYEPETGRYLTSDPIGLGGGARSYGYVHNPQAWVDPLGLAGECTPKEIARANKAAGKVIERAQRGVVTRSSEYHGRLPSDVESDILSDPDGVYLSEGGARRMTFAKDGNVVLTEGPGSAQGNIITSYGPAGPQGESGAAIFGGEPTAPGQPVTPDMITDGMIPDTKGGTMPPAVQVWP